MDLAKLMMERISNNLSRSSISCASEWAEKYRIVNGSYAGKWTFDHHPWLREMHDSQSPINIGQKAAQMGYTETLLNIALYTIDVKRIDCLYLLPAQTPDAKNFSSSRFNPAIQSSAYLTALFSEVDNVGHKQAGSTNLYVRGTRSRSGLKNLATGLILFDEYEEMDQKMARLAEERGAGQKDPMIWKISTPFVGNAGINKEFNRSSKQKFYFECPGCSKWVDLTFPDCIEICGESVVDLNVHKSYYKCPECNKKLEHELKPHWLKNGKWIAENPEMTPYSRGWHIPQMYSPARTAPSIVESYFKGVINPADQQEFYNSQLGIPFVLPGSQVTDEEIDKAVENKKYQSFYSPVMYKSRLQDNYITMGADIGLQNHVQINLWEYDETNSLLEVNFNAKPTIIFAQPVSGFDDLDRLMRDYYVNFAVIDANPERRLATKFIEAHPYRSKMCFYGNGVVGRKINPTVSEEGAVTVDRTSWMDMFLCRFKSGLISLPLDISYEYRDHMKSVVARYENDLHGNPIRHYFQVDGKPDHFVHAGTYAEIALPLAFVGGEVGNIQ